MVASIELATATSYMPFEIIQPVERVETIASGKAVRAQKRLRQKYGKGYWRKRKGIACVKFENGLVAKAELHWYEATGIGKKEFKIKRLLG
jgi:hypothetical protein